MIKKTYRPYGDPPYEPPADIWHEPTDGSEPEIERLKRLGSNSVAFEETEETRPGKWLHITGCDGTPRGVSRTDD